jgi:lysozyme
MKRAFGNEGAFRIFQRLANVPRRFGKPLTKCHSSLRFRMVDSPPLDIPKPIGRQGPFRNIGLLITTTITALVVAFLLWSGSWIPNAPPHAAYPIRGIDVSHHQREIDWRLIDGVRIQFAYIKATEGADFKDTKFSENWTAAGNVGLRRGAYHFFTLGTGGAQQANNFIATVPKDETALPPAIDLEMSGYNRGRAQAVPDFQRELTIFTKMVAKHYDKTPVIYITKDFQRQFLRGYRVDRLWIREVVFWPSRGWTLWQFSPRARLRGVSGAVDLNAFNGDASEFEAFIDRKADVPEDARRPSLRRRQKK